VPPPAQPQPESAAVQGLEWPGWRGPQGNGFSPEVPDRLPPEKLLWRREMAGECHAPISAAAGCVVVADHDPNRDDWRCFAAADGRVRWVHDYANTEKMEFGAAPRAAPRIFGGRAYCLSAWGELFCLDLADGEVVWKKHLAREFHQKTPTWGYCGSPLVVDGKLIVSPGGEGGPVAALRPDTGDVVWTGEGKGLNYASFIAGTFGGVAQVVGYDETTAGGWDVKTGRRLWSLEVANAAGYLVPSPVAVAGGILLTSDQEDARLFGFDSNGAIEPEPRAQNQDVAPDVATPTVWGETILGAYAGLVLMDASAAGDDLLKTVWIYYEDDSVNGLCHTIVSEDRALVMCEDGQLLLLAFDRDACRILDRRKVCEKTWVHPALAYGRLYVRDKTTLYCYAMPDLGSELD
jgi:outer membrane protein assembly factor BamB